VEQFSKKVTSQSGIVYKAFKRVYESDTEKEAYKKYWGNNVKTESYFLENSSFTILFDSGTLDGFMKKLKFNKMRMSGGNWKKDGMIKC
jgi:hypothetical protein